jgi:hypothetical protein
MKDREHLHLKTLRYYNKLLREGGMKHRDHRRNKVRREIRHLQLAIGFLEGQPYAVMEPKTRTPPDFLHVAKFVQSYGRFEDRRRFPTWCDEALSHLATQPHICGYAKPLDSEIRREFERGIVSLWYKDKYRGVL